MKKSRTRFANVWCLLLAVWTFVFAPFARAESLSQEYSTISPIMGSGGGEFVHGQKEGKILIRTLVFGAVPVQGIHFVPEGTDLLFGILYAGGYTDTSKLNGITIRRRNVKDIINVDLEDLIQSGQAVPKLSDGDIITVPFNWRRDISTITLITGFVSSMTAFTLSIIALTRNNNN
jgi:hypothetical protein